jgi:hypothetical protein
MNHQQDFGMSEDKNISDITISSDTNIDAPVFLRDVQEIKEDLPPEYNLRDEFIKAGKNLPIPLYIAITAIAAAVLGFTFWMTYAIQKDVDSVAVNISDFKDLNLEELMSTLKNAEQNLSQMEKGLSTIRTQMDAEIEKIRLKYAADMRRVESNNLPDETKKKLIAQLRAEQDRKIGAIRGEYSASLTEKDRQAQEVRSQLDEYKKQAKHQMDEFTSAMDKKLSTYRMESQERETAATRLLSQKDEAMAKKLEAQKIEYDAAIHSYDQKLNDLTSQLRKESDKSIATEKLLSMYKKALSFYSQSSGEHGIVINQEIDDRILIDMNPFVSVKNGDKGLVIDRSNRVLATIEFAVSGQTISARITKRMNDTPIKPFDTVLVNRN